MWSFEFAIEFIGKMHEGVEEVMQSVWNATSVWGGGTLPHMEYVIDPTMKSVIKGEPPPLIDVLLPD